MTLITIREQAKTESGFDAVVSFDHTGEYKAAIANPFTEKEEKRLEWYYEEHLRYPYLEHVRAEAAAASVRDYGVALFDQVFAERRAFAAYQRALQAGVGSITFEIAGSPEFHALHWEALADPDLPQPLAVQGTMVRKNLRPQVVEADPRPQPTINLLVVTARPGGRRDVGYRTISRPLVEGLRRADLRVNVDLVRPGTYPALVAHLERAVNEHGPGYYHAVHFDVHGGLLTFAQFDAVEKGLESDRHLFQPRRYGRSKLALYEGVKAFLFLESEREGHPDPVEADELAALLLKHQIPAAILNACQSGKQVGESETSLGARLMQAGVQLVLAMGYSVTVSAAELLMKTLYREIFAGRELAEAIRRGRLELYNDKRRRAYYDQTIELEDWLLPVVYLNRPVRLSTREMSAAEHRAYFERQAGRYQPPPLAYGFVGRDLDVLNVERRLLGADGRNLLLIRGMGGAGKTTLLHHLGQWWQRTGLVDQVFYFGFDQRAWTRQQIMAEIGQRLLGEVDYLRFMQPLDLDAQQEFLSQRLRARRHLLILDNLESVTGSHLAIGETLPEAQRAALAGFLSALTGGKTLVLLGSRGGGEGWLTGSSAAPLRAADVYDLPGLDPEAASTLADRVLARHHATQHRADPAFERLLKLLDGYPLPIEVVLANLERQTPAQVLTALEEGLAAIDTGKAGKTESLLACIDYSFGNLDPGAQDLLACLAPFSGVINTGLLAAYTEQLRAQPALAGLDYGRWREVLSAAADWGLVAAHELPGYLRVQPIFPYFLRVRLAGRAEQRAAIEAAFQAFYDGFGGALAQMMTSKKVEEKQLGQVLARLEYENLYTALNYAFDAQVPILNLYHPLSLYLDATQDQQRGQTLGETVLEKFEAYSAEKRQGIVGATFAGVIDNIAKRQLLQKDYQAAEASYKKALNLLQQLEDIDKKSRTRMKAGVYHQLGIVAQEQRQWDQAEHYYQQALQIKIDFDDRYEQAGTYHQLGIVAQEQRQWDQAEQYYQQALQIYIDFDDRYEQAGTYHNLGIVAQEQRQWDQAEQYYQQALQIFIDFDDRYEQAGTYHQLGRVAQEQRQWDQAEQYFLTALQIGVEYSDEYRIATRLQSLARLWQNGHTPDLPARVAAVLGISPAEAEALLGQAGGAGE